MIKNKIAARLYFQKIKRRWRRKGLCTRCGIEKAFPRHRTCVTCQQYARNYLRCLKEKVLRGYGHRCVCCGIREYEFLSIDHKFNDGAKDRKRSRMSSLAFYRRLIRERFPRRYQCMCYNCNLALAFFGCCPHRPEIHRIVRRK